MKTVDPTIPRATGADRETAEQALKNRDLVRFLDDLLRAEPTPDDQSWSEFKAALNANRGSGRKHFLD